MANPDGMFPKVKGVIYEPIKVFPDAVSGGVIPAGARVVVVGAVTNDANDWIVLPRLAKVENGHEIIILNNAGGNFELRTPASSNEKINNVDADGSQEYLMTDTQYVKIIKLSPTVGWMAHDYTAVGAVVAAHVPD